MITMVDCDQVLLHLVRKAKAGDDRAFDKIVKILEPDLKRSYGNGRFYIAGADDQDVIQECRIGVWKAIKDFNESMGMQFKNFAVSLCVKRHLITAMSHANTQKFRIQNNAESLSASASQGDDEVGLTKADFIPDPNSDILESYIIQEEFNTNLNMITENLTGLEFSIFGQYAFNSSYKDIAAALDVKPKTVDNALMRIRKKANQVYQIYSVNHSVISAGYSSSLGLCSSYFPTAMIGINTAVIGMV